MQIKLSLIAMALLMWFFAVQSKVKLGYIILRSKA